MNRRNIHGQRELTTDHTDRTDFREQAHPHPFNPCYQWFPQDDRGESGETDR